MWLLILCIFLLVFGLISLFSWKRKADENAWEVGPSVFHWMGVICFILVILLPILCSFETVNSGTVKVGRLFGKIQKQALTEGLNAVNPLVSWTTMNIQRNSIQADDADQTPGMTSTTADNNQATIQANFGYALNPKYAWWVLKYIGNETKFRTELLEKSAQSATRDALAHFKLEESQIGKRTSFEELLQEQFADNVFINLPKNELDTLELRSVFNIYPTQLMEVKPDPKVANALAEKKAIEINLEQQKTMTKIAEETGNRKQAEGKGIRKLIEELPKGVSAQDVSLILNASANKTRADAFMRAVTDGKVNFGVFEGGANAAVSMNQCH